MRAGLLFWFVLSLSSVSSAAGPNFVVINIDDLGYADIGPYGSTLNRTPSLDRMAKEGRKLTCFYAAPVCSPSRSSLMTGCYPKRVLPIPNVLFPASAVGLNPDESTVAELLKSAGYTTGCIGKWHLGDQPPFLPTRQGFDYYLGLPYSNDMGTAEDGAKSSLGESPSGGSKKSPAKAKKVPAKAAPVNKSDVAETGLTGADQPPLPLLENEKVIARVRQDEQVGIVERYTAAAETFLEANRDKPFFLYLAHTAVHFPLYPGKAFQNKSKNGLYGDWVEEVDWSVGKVFDKLRELHLDGNTFVLFISDNGGTPRAVNTPLRGFKGSTWEGGMRVPAIAWWPGKIPAGTSCDAVTGMMDVLPTLVKLAGGSLPADRKIDGGDLWPLLTGQPDAKPLHEVFYFYRGLQLEAVRCGPWKLHLARGELYQLEKDIAESENVAGANADVVAKLRGLAAEADKDLGVSGVGPGCRPMGRVTSPQPLIDRDGAVREGFAAASP